MGRKMPNAVVIAGTAVLLLVTVETVLGAVAAADSKQDFDSGADGKIKSLNIELIKSSILDKLGMQRPPEVGDRLLLQDLVSKYNNEHASSTAVPPEIRHKSDRIDATGDGDTDIRGYKAATTSTDTSINSDDDDDNYHVKTQKLIAFAQPHPTVLQILQGQYPLYFTFSEQTQHYRITKAILWVYKRRLDVVIDNSVVIINVYRIDPVDLQRSLVSSVKRVLNTTEPGWVPIELQTDMSDWFKTIDEVKNLTLMIQAYYPNKNNTHNKMPFITDARKRDNISKIPYLEMHTQRGYRKRRGAAGTFNGRMLEADCAADSRQGLDSGGIKSLNAELIKSSILKELRMQPTIHGLPHKIREITNGNDQASSTAAPPFFFRNKSIRIDATGDGGTDGRCRKHPVDLDELCLDQIIAPKRFVFYYCSGECNSTMPTSGQEARPAAKIQCCVPRKKSSLSVLYMDNIDLNINYKLLPGIVVDECGCK